MSMPERDRDGYIRRVAHEITVDELARATAGMAHADPWVKAVELVLWLAFVVWILWR